MQAQRLPFGQDLIHDLVREALLVTVFSCPAAGAVHVAGAGGVHQHDPGDIAAKLRGSLLRRFVSPESALISGVQKKRRQDIGICFFDHPICVPRPFAVRVPGDLMKLRVGFLLPGVAQNLLDQIDETVCDLCGVSFLRLVYHSVQCELKCFPFCGMNYICHVSCLLLFCSFRYSPISSVR